jgi:hypothetical protein
VRSLGFEPRPQSEYQIACLKVNAPERRNAKFSGNHIASNERSLQ